MSLLEGLGPDVFVCAASVAHWWLLVLFFFLTLLFLLFLFLWLLFNGFLFFFNFSFLLGLCFSLSLPSFFLFLLLLFLFLVFRISFEMFLAASNYDIFCLLLVSVEVGISPQEAENGVEESVYPFLLLDNVHKQSVSPCVLHSRLFLVKSNMPLYFNIQISHFMDHLTQHSNSI